MGVNKVTLLQEAILSLSKEINKNGEATKQQAKELKKLKEQYEKVNKLMPQYRKKHEEINKELKKANVLTSNLEKTNKGFFGKLKNAVGTLFRYGLAYKAINLVTTAFNELTIGSIKQSIAFQKALANLSAVAGASAKEVEALGKNALEVAGSTKFTAQEIVGLQTSLAKLGFTSEDVIKSTQGIANTAQALGAPLEQVAEQTGKVINQFKLLIEQSEFVGDVLVTTINNSALSFDSFGTAIQYVGPIARNLGLSIEQTAGAMAVLSDNGFTASRVGTGLRGIFTELGKTSADVEGSLRDLAEENISLSEAVDLVGKRNAAQLITLLDNIEALDEGTEKYYQQGRALDSASKNIDTFSGQLGLLNSAFREFQINIGKSVAESDILLKVLDGFFPAAAKTARGFKAINDIGFDNFSKGAKEVQSGSSALRKSLELLDISVEEYEMALSNANVTQTSFLDFLPEGFSKAGDASLELINSVEGLSLQLNKSAEEGKRQELILQGQTLASEEYEESIRKITKAFSDGNNVNEESNKLSKEINDKIKEYQSIIETTYRTETNVFTGRASAIKVDEEQILVYKGLVGVLQGYNEQLVNATISAKQLQTIFDKTRKEASKEEAKRVKDAIKFADIEYQKQVEQINNTAELQTILQQQILDSEVSTSEERTAAIQRIAEIEEQRQQDVSETYKRKAKSLMEINIQYEENEKLIDNALRKAQKYSEILDNDIVSDASKALKNYNDESKNLAKQLKDKTIGQEEYNEKLQDNQDSFEEYIKNLITANNLGKDAEKILLGMVDAYNKQSVALQENNKMTLENADSFEDFIQLLKDDEDFLKDLIANILGQAIDSTEEVLNSFNDLVLDNTVGRLEQEIDAIERRYQIEEDILKSSLNNQLITESQYRAKQIELQKAKLAEENSINKQIFEAEKKQETNDAKIDGLAAIAEAYINAFTTYKDPLTAFAIGSIFAGLIGAQTGFQVSAINQRQFFPKKFAEGGVVNGPSHDQGGVPFTVQGRGGYEMEGGEYIVNKRATAMHRDLLERINKSGRLNPTVGRMKFAEGGLVSSPLNESVDYLKAIAEATTSTAIGVSKPVRAYVADKDLRTDSTERRIRDRNDRI